MGAVEIREQGDVLSDTSEKSDLVSFTTLVELTCTMGARRFCSGSAAALGVVCRVTAPSRSSRLRQLSLNLPAAAAQRTVSVAYDHGG